MNGAEVIFLGLATLVLLVALPWGDEKPQPRLVWAAAIGLIIVAWAVAL